MFVRIIFFLLALSQICCTPTKTRTCSRDGLYGTRAVKRLGSSGDCHYAISSSSSIGCSVTVYQGGRLVLLSTMSCCHKLSNIVLPVIIHPSFSHYELIYIYYLNFINFSFGSECLQEKCLFSRFIFILVIPYAYMLYFGYVIDIWGCLIVFFQFKFELNLIQIKW